VDLSTQLLPDIIASFFFVASVYYAIKFPDSISNSFICGLFMGLVYQTRLTYFFLIIFYVAIFIKSKKKKKLLYFLIGFFAVFTLSNTYFFINTGQAFPREKAILRYYNQYLKYGVIIPNLKLSPEKVDINELKKAYFKVKFGLTRLIFNSVALTILFIPALLYSIYSLLNRKHNKIRWIAAFLFLYTYLISEFFHPYKHIRFIAIAMPFLCIVLADFIYKTIKRSSSGAFAGITYLLIIAITSINFTLYFKFYIENSYSHYFYTRYKKAYELIQKYVPANVAVYIYNVNIAKLLFASSYKKLKDNKYLIKPFVNKGKFHKNFQYLLVDFRKLNHHKKIINFLIKNLNLKPVGDVNGEIILWRKQV